jgi:hypothetical protein
MVSKSLSFAALFCSCLSYGSELIRVTTSAALLYPFTGIELLLFYNEYSQKIESPYSVASVGFFSATKKVPIEKSAYEKLHTHAKNRSRSVALQFFKRYEDLKGKETYTYNTIAAVCTAVLFHNARLRNMEVIHDQANPTQVVLSERDLMHLLQWSRGITMVFEICKGREKGFFIDIALDQHEILIAPKLLKQFIMHVGAREQEKKQRFFGSKA